MVYAWVFFWWATLTTAPDQWVDSPLFPSQESCEAVRDATGGTTLPCEQRAYTVEDLAERLRAR